LTPRREWALAGALLAVLLLQLVWGLRTDGMTDDELVYIGAGYRHVHGDFRINPEQPPLAKLLGAAALLGLDLVSPAPQKEEDQCGWSYRFIHAANRQAPLVSRARLPVIVLMLGLAVAIGQWARVVGGPGAGLLALALAAFQPAFLAHGHLITTDLPGAAAMLAASWALWWFLRAPSLARAALVAVAVAIAVLTRLTAAILGPILLLAVLLEWRTAPDRARWARGLVQLALAHLVVVPLVIWATYGFRYAPFPGSPASYEDWPPGVAAAVVRVAADHHLLPQAFLEGLRFQIDHSQRGHSGYLLGDRGTSGWWYYYLVVLVAKNTPGFLLLLALAAWRTMRGRISWSPALRQWLVAAIAILLAASAGRIQIGERYILPVYPFLILWIAVTAAPLLASIRGRSVVGLCLAAHAFSALSAAPRGYLTYFNPVAAPSAARGEPWVADSNLDWGQDLPRLAAWMRDHQVARVQLAYFGSDDPDRYGIAHEDLPTWHSHHPIHPPSSRFHGTVVISPNLLLGFLMPPGKSPYDVFLDRRPDARVGSLLVYDVGE